jgi:hypothetical protein
MSNINQKFNQELVQRENEKLTLNTLPITLPNAQVTKKTQDTVVKQDGKVVVIKHIESTF